MGSFIKNCLFSILAIGLLATSPSPAAPYNQGRLATAECQNLDASQDICWWNYSYDSAKCSDQKPCRHLVIHFADQTMGCDKALYGGTRPDIDKIVQSYADRGFIAVTACWFDKEVNALNEPMHRHTARLSKLLQVIRDTPQIRDAWTGEYLLFAGHGLGASAPVVTMFRSKEDALPHWGGSRYTGACFSEGMYDIEATDQYWTGAKSCESHRAQAICQRYLGAKNCSSPLVASAAAQIDTVSSGCAIRNLSITNWKFIECGSGLTQPRCGPKGDFIPAAPIHKLCSQINSQFGYRCEVERFPQLSYSSCAADTSTINSCADWFASATQRL